MTGLKLCWLHLRCKPGAAPELSETPTRNCREGDYPGHYSVEVPERKRWVVASISPLRLGNVAGAFEQMAGIYTIDCWCFEEEKEAKIKEMCAHLRELVENDARKLTDSLEHLAHLEDSPQTPRPR